VIEVDRLSKSFGPVRAVDALSFSVRPGAVTGFLGPNGAGKTTTLRMLLGLVTPDSGSATIGGRRYRDIPHPAHEVGAALELSGFHPGRSARDHLRVLAPQVGVGDRRCDEVLATVGLSGAARRRVGGYSLGMRQRLALAAALLGDPQVLVLDEPANGLDPQGIVWLREFLRHLAHRQGRTVLVSSHVLGEVQETVDDVVVVAGGRLVSASPLHELIAAAAPRVRVAGPNRPGLEAALARAGWVVSADGDVLLVSGADPGAVGRVAFAAGLELHELTAERPDLESVFLRLTEARGGRSDTAGADQ
jgi:ABC-2 type transport system ATP-binding protein